MNASSEEIPVALSLTANLTTGAEINDAREYFVTFARWGLPNAYIISLLLLACTNHWKRLMCLSLIIYYLAQVFHPYGTTVSSLWNNCFILMEQLFHYYGTTVPL